MPKVSSLEKEGQPQASKPADAAAANGQRTVLVEVPIGERLPSDFPIHLDLRLDSRKGAILRRVAHALDRQHAKLLNGRRVVDASTAVRWLLEQLEQVESPA